MAAGTISTTKIIFNYLNFFESKKIYSNPTASFMAFNPFQIGKINLM